MGRKKTFLITERGEKPQSQKERGLGDVLIRRKLGENRMGDGSGDCNSRFGDGGLWTCTRTSD